MKVGLTAGTFAADNIQVDGIGSYTANLSAVLTNHLDIQVSHYVYRGRNRSYQLTPQLQYFPTTFRKSLLRALLLNQSYLHESHIDLFHATDHCVPKLKNIPVVATVHDAIPLLHPEWVSPQLRTVKNWLLRKTVSWADHIIAISHAAVPDLAKAFNIAQDRISVVYNGVSDIFFQQVAEAKRQEVLQKYQLEPGYFLFIGTLQPRKNLERLIQAHRNLPQAVQKRHPLIIVGRNGWRTEGLLQKIKQLDDSKHGKWLEYVPQDEINSLLQSALAFIFPSLYEGFGLPVLEAFAAKIPVITSNVTSLPEVADDAAILIDPYSPKHIQNAMEEVITNTSMRNELIERGYHRARQMTWLNCAKQTLEVYKKLS